MQQFFDYFKKNPITVKQIRKYLIGKENLKNQLLQKYNNYKDRFSFLAFIRYFLLGVEDKKCLKCGKLLNNQQIRKDAEYCSRQCANSSDLVKYNRKDAFLKKYGVTNPSQIVGVEEKKRQSYLKHYGVVHPLKSKQIIQKIKKTNLQKYGVQFGLSNKDIQQKSRKTVQEKYGCLYISQNEDIKNKIKKTNLQKYGCSCVFKNEEIRNKIKKTNLQKYGFQCISKNEEIKNKVRKTNLQRYGVQSSFLSSDIREKSKQTNLYRYGTENYFSSWQFLTKNRLDVYESLKQKFKDYVVPLFKESEYIGYRNKQQYKWKCVQCGNQWKQHLHISYHIDGTQTYIPRCLNCYPFTVFSKSQQQLFSYIKSFFENIVDKDRKIIYPYQLDIYIPQKNIAIEFDGLYWHGQKKKDKNYHLMKTEMCLQKGIQLIHIFEDEWLYKQQIVKDRIKNILGIYDNRIFARKCTIKEIKPSVCKQFLDNNHIQGRDNSKIRLGLFYNDQLISVMTFGKPRFNKNYEYELVRFASKLGIKVVGGASKLLKYFERNYNPKSIISYADRRYSNGKLYYALGFQFLQNSEPSYKWYKNYETYSRYQCQKHKLKELLGQQNFNPYLSQSQNMYLNGYNKIYDCGNIVFIKQF